MEYPGKKPRSKLENKLVIAITLIFLRNQNLVQSKEKFFWRNVISAMTILQNNSFSYMQKGEKVINTIQRSVKIENIS